jgi:hypothetical protein
VDFPNDAFRLAGGAGNAANLLRVPTPMVLDTAFAEGPNASYPSIKMTRHVRTVQPRSRRIGAELDYTRSLDSSRWRHLRRPSCRCLRTFHRLVTYIVHLTSRQPSISRPERDRGPNLVRQDIPGRFLPPAANQGDGPVAAALGGFTHEYRVQIAETLARGTAEGLGTPNSHYETPRRTGCYYR